MLAELSASEQMRGEALPNGIAGQSRTQTHHFNRHPCGHHGANAGAYLLFSRTAAELSRMLLMQVKSAIQDDPYAFAHKNTPVRTHQ